MSDGKTTSATVTAGIYTYIFLNRPLTSTIDVIRFDASQEDIAPVQGTISNGDNEIKVKEGPIGVIFHFTNDAPATHLTIYYFKASGGIGEAKLDNASEPETDPKRDWRVKDSDIRFVRGVPTAALVDGRSFLAAASQNNRPAVVYSTKNEGEDIINYAWLNEKNIWKSHVLEAPKS